MFNSREWAGAWLLGMWVVASPGAGLTVTLGSPHGAYLSGPESGRSTIFGFDLMKKPKLGL